MANLFLHIYRFFSTNRKFFVLALLCSFGITGYFALQIKPVEDISGMLPHDKQSQKLNDILQNARFADKLVLMISLKDSSRRAPEELMSFSDSFSSRIQSNYSGFIQGISDRIDDRLAPELVDLVRRHLPVFLEKNDYQDIQQLDDPEKMRAVLEKDIQSLSSPAAIGLKPFITNDPLGIAGPVYKKIRNLQYDESFDLYNGHIITRDERYMLLFIHPAFPANNTGKNSEMLRGIDNVIDSLQKSSFKDVDALYFGTVAVAAGNAEQLRRDTVITLGITAVFLLLFLSWYFGRKRAPVIILLPVLFGALFALSMMYWIQGSISVIALAAGSVVLGIAINYSLHVYNHFRHRRNMQQVLTDLAMPLTIGSLTTIGGFFCLLFVRADLLKDLGLFAGFSLIGASLCSLIFLPHLISASVPVKTSTDTKRNSWMARFAGYHPEKNKWLVGSVLGLTVILAFFIHRVRFDQDMMHLNYMPEKLKKAESTLNAINAYALRSVYVVTDGNTLQEALNRQALVDQQIRQLHDRQLIKKYSGAFQFLLSDSVQQERIRYWSAYWTENKKVLLIQNLRNQASALGFTPAISDPVVAILSTPFRPLDQQEIKTLRSGLANDYIIEKNGKVSLISLLQVEPGDKEEVARNFSGINGVTVTDKQYLTSRLLDVVTADFNQIGWMVSLLVFFVLLLTYGRIELALVSFIPMVIAFVWILGIMGLAGLEFNIVNIILSALIFGLGDDYSLFIMDGLLQEYRTGKKNLDSYKSSIVLSAITTLAGLGVLIFARHPALKSIALISITGIFSVVLIAPILIPFLFHFLISSRIQKNRFPWTASGLAKSIFSLSYFAIGSWVVTGIGFIILKWNPFAGRRCRELYHRILSSYTWSVLYIMGNVKKKIINEHRESFATPVVMIANHQSFLDILVMTMLYPKVILLTNDWVWNSPIFGQLVRMAGYYPTARGIENSTDYLETQVKKGFSIAVFPEGTRSPDDQIKRFHKGAFFIAEKLNLDILPVLIHGTGYTMSKGDFLLKDGHVTIKYLPRIPARDMFFGVDYSEKAKYIGRYFRAEYRLLKQEQEQPRFFREQLIYNYIYKGPVLEWYLRVKIRLEKDYQLFHEQLPKKGRILDIGCGYGFMSYMLQFAASEREITGYDYDEDKIAVAAHCFSKNERLQFVHADATQLDLDAADAIIISDLLHYLHPQEQQKLIEKCMEVLRPNGILFIRDGDRDLQKKHRFTRLSEFFSTRFFSFNKTDGQKLNFLSGHTIRDLSRKHHMDCKAVDTSEYTSNLLFRITHAEHYEKV